MSDARGTISLESFYYVNYNTFTLEFKGICIPNLIQEAYF